MLAPETANNVGLVANGDATNGGNGNGGNGNGHGNGRERLDSWKAISAYLGRDEATLRRWESTRGLPIRRVPGKKGASVYAYRDEIDAWLLTGQVPGPPPADPPSSQPPPVPSATIPARPLAGAKRMRWAAAAIVTVAAIAAALYFPSRGHAVGGGIHFDVSESAVRARDEDDRPLWVYSYENTHRHVLSQLNESTRISRSEPASVFAASSIRFRRSDNLVEAGRLTALDIGGSLRWRFEFEDTISMAGRSYGGPWGLDGFAIEDSDGRRRVAIAGHHYTWSPSMVAVVDDTGRRLMRYFNDGWMERVHWVPGGRLAVSGYSMSRAGGMIALLDPARADGQSPDEATHRCDNCGSDLPLHLAVMPRSEINTATASRFNRALVDLIGDRLVVRTEEVPPSSGQPPAEAIYEFDYGLRLLKASYSDRYWELHDQLFASKTLDHDRSTCPHRDGPSAYQAWSADAGWTTVKAAR